MKIKAINGYEASKQILQVIYASDYNHSKYKPLVYGYTYVYYSPQLARFYFEKSQRKIPIGLIKRYIVLDTEDIIRTTANKYSFAQVALGAINSRKIMTYGEFFELVKNNFEWLE